jgi:hypothetical protein
MRLAITIIILTIISAIAIVFVIAFLREENRLQEVDISNNIITHNFVLEDLQSLNYSTDTLFDLSLSKGYETNEEIGEVK